MEKITIAGGTGFLGNALEAYFKAKGMVVQILTRNPTQSNHIYWDAKTLGDWSQCLENTDVLINLTGKSIDCRFTESNKKTILDSRIDSTQILQKAIDTLQHPPKIWLNASGSSSITENELFEDMPFMSRVCKLWESAFFGAQNPNIRKVSLRTSVVLGNEGGAFPKLRFLAKMGLGGKVGSGNQLFSWIHVDDYCGAIQHIIQQPDLVGPINIVTPKPLSNKDLMAAIRQAVKMPLGIITPAFILEYTTIFTNIEPSLLLDSFEIYPDKLLKQGFKFKFQSLRAALENLLKL